MKTKLILGSLIALASFTNAQNIFPTGAGTYAGIGTTSPTYPLDIQLSGGSTGIKIQNNGSDSPHVNFITSGTGAGNFMVGVCGINQTEGNGRFVIHDANAHVTRLLIDPNGNVGIGTTTPANRLHVIGSTIGTGVRGDALTGVAGNGVAPNTQSSAAGVTGRASGGGVNWGGWFIAVGGASGISSYGVRGEVSNLSAGGTNYAIYGTVGGNPNSGAGPNFAGYFNGDVVTTSASFYPSDKRIKKDITKLSSSLNLINKLNPVTYNFDSEANPSIALPDVKQYGFISQEVKELLPEFTKTIVHPAKLDEEGKVIYPAKEILGLNYNGFIALLTKGMQEQQVLIENQQKQLDEQKQLISELKSGTATGINNVNTVETGFQMSQNVPNPFTNETVVKYTLPETVSNAFIAVYDLTGKQITTFAINQKGSSSLTLTSEKLAAGIYIYSIVADGKVVDSKRMIVAEK